LPHAVNVTPLESFAGWLGFALARMRSPCLLRIRWTVRHEQGRSNWCLIRRAPHAGYFSLSRIFRRSNDRDIARGERFDSVFFARNPFSGSWLWAFAYRLTILSEMLYDSPISLAVRIPSS
jgi:hypothetical protein